MGSGHVGWDLPMIFHGWCKINQAAIGFSQRHSPVMLVSHQGCPPCMPSVSPWQRFFRDGISWIDVLLNNVDIWYRLIPELCDSCSASRWSSSFLLSSAWSFWCFYASWWVAPLGFLRGPAMKAGGWIFSSCQAQALGSLHCPNLPNGQLPSQVVWFSVFLVTFAFAFGGGAFHHGRKHWIAGDTKITKEVKWHNRFTHVYHSLVIFSPSWF